MKSPEQLLTVVITVHAPMATVWACWTSPEHIRQWNNPSGDWYTSHVENEVRPGGRFLFVMQAKDNSSRFDFGGTYDEVQLHEKISYTLSDGRKTVNLFTVTPEGIKISEIFEPETGTPPELQRDFTSGVLKSFKTYAENIFATSQTR